MVNFLPHATTVNRRDRTAPTMNGGAHSVINIVAIVVKMVLRVRIVIDRGSLIGVE